VARALPAAQPCRTISPLLQRNVRLKLLQLPHIAGLVRPERAVGAGAVGRRGEDTLAEPDANDASDIHGFAINDVTAN